MAAPGRIVLNEITGAQCARKSAVSRRALHFLCAENRTSGRESRGRGYRVRRDAAAFGIGEKQKRVFWNRRKELKDEKFKKMNFL